MKCALLSALAVASAVTQASAHYLFPALVVDGKSTGDWVNVRMTNNHYSNGPVTDVTSPDIRCYTSETNAGATTANVTAGSTVGFTAVTDISHPGPALVYMAKAPSQAAGWDGSGAVWFKIFEMPPTISASGMTWPSSGLTQINFPIPKSLPSGQYLIRVEHIALHTAGSAGGAQFYLSCGQVNVANGRSGSPSPLVSFPGAYKATDPGILINIYYPVPTSYTMPGPAVWHG
ncbi:fungal cellulose binding domain-containing protein [Exidia glandulosa HHB12029]|uniref:lytic cellulose monooxygenase (C4-dehydrogenating) n=1 Tax=Exidia glandulosa HHB12029 TaxID=1314781 RepID=A0A165QZH3_EXIGL|nr:fungal cellulose binding domain-containing protein [Exidia glandulosa HHB12029]